MAPRYWEIGQTTMVWILIQTQGCTGSRRMSFPFWAAFCRIAVVLKVSVDKKWHVIKKQICASQCLRWPLQCVLSSKIQSWSKWYKVYLKPKNWAVQPRWWGQRTSSRSGSGWFHLHCHLLSFWNLHDGHTYYIISTNTKHIWAPQKPLNANFIYLNKLASKDDMAKRKPWTVVAPADCSFHS